MPLKDQWSRMHALRGIASAHLFRSDIFHLIEPQVGRLMPMNDHIVCHTVNCAHVSRNIVLFL